MPVGHCWGQNLPALSFCLSALICRVAYQAVVATPYSRQHRIKQLLIMVEAEALMRGAPVLDTVLQAASIVLHPEYTGPSAGNPIRKECPRGMRLLRNRDICDRLTANGTTAFPPPNTDKGHQRPRQVSAPTPYRHGGRTPGRSSTIPCQVAGRSQRMTL